jgi:hypothetical protein
MDLESVLVPLGFFGMVFAIVAVSVWGGVQTRREFNETIRRAIDNGQQLDPKVINTLAKPERTAEHDLRGGVMLVCLAVGFGLCGFLFENGSPASVHQAPGTLQIDSGGVGFYAIAVIVGALGVGRLLAAYLRRDRKAT